MHVPRSGIAIFNFLRKLHTVIHSSHTNLLPYHILAYIRYLLGFVYFLFVLVIAIPTSVMQYLIMALICISC